MSHNLIQLLRDSIKTCVSAKNESLRWFVKQAGASYSVVYRIMSGEQSTITFYQAYRLLKYLQPDTFITTLAEYFPNETREFFPAGRELEEPKRVDNEKLFSEIMRDQFVYEVMLAIQAGNDTLKQIESEFGSRGLVAVETLQDIGAIEISTEAVIKQLFDCFMTSDELLIKQQAQRNVDLIDLKVAGTTLFSYSAGLNAKGIAEAWHCEQAHWKQMLDIFDKEEFKGKIPVIVTGLVGPVSRGENK
jgi:hypothetical protein